MKSSAVIIQQGDKILLSKRSSNLSEAPNKWENVGGSLDEGESFEEAAIREVKEELGVSLSIKGLALEYKDQSGETVCKVFYGKIKGEPKRMEDLACDKIEWFNKGQLQGIDLARFTKNDFISLGYISE